MVIPMDRSLLLIKHPRFGQYVGTGTQSTHPRAMCPAAANSGKQV